MEIEQSSGAPADPKVQLGVRPQDVRTADPSDAVGRIDVVQPLGSEVVMLLKLPGGDGEVPLTAVLPAEVPVRVDDRMGVRFCRDRLHLFRADGTRLR